mgnify:CR=1 FL=1
MNWLKIIVVMLVIGFIGYLMALLLKVNTLGIIIAVEVCLWLVIAIGLITSKNKSKYRL